MPLCVNADKNTIPTTDAGTSGLFSEEKGFQTINSLPLTAGGKAPARQDFNGVFALLGGIAYATQRGFVFEWDANQDYAVGCVVLDTNDNKRYECINDVSANSTPPSADSTNWQIYVVDRAMYNAVGQELLGLAMDIVITDPNIVYATGIFSIGASSSNIPVSGSKNGILENFGSNGFSSNGKYLQRYQQSSTGKTWTRSAFHPTAIGSDWTAWTQL
jgi:hypothetical protein